MNAVSRADLDEVLQRTPALWSELAGARIFITGGTGFVGSWLLETFLHANREHSLGAQAIVLTRRPEAFAAALPHLTQDAAVHLVPGDVRDFEAPPGAFSHAIHAAADVANARSPLETFDTAVDGTRRVLEFCRRRGVGKLLLLSSGAVYGPQPPHIERIAEAFGGAPATTAPDTAYAQGKRAAEWLVSAWSAQHGPAARIARLFAVVGPRLPLDRHFAAGNFIRDALHGGPIRVGGDGTPLRSYLYAADMAAWLWTIFLKGQPGQAYNVGADAAVSIAELAGAVAQAVAPGTAITLARRSVPGAPVERYVPDISKARNQLGLEPWTPLAEALARTASWAASAGAAAPEARRAS